MFDAPTIIITIITIILFIIFSLGAWEWYCGIVGNNDETLKQRNARYDSYEKEKK